MPIERLWAWAKHHFTRKCADDAPYHNQDAMRRLVRDVILYNYRKELRKHIENAWKWWENGLKWIPSVTLIKTKIKRIWSRYQKAMLTELQCSPSRQVQTSSATKKKEKAGLPEACQPLISMHICIQKRGSKALETRKWHWISLQEKFTVKRIYCMHSRSKVSVRLFF